MMPHASVFIFKFINYGCSFWLAMSLTFNLKEILMITQSQLIQLLIYDNFDFNASGKFINHGCSFWLAMRVTFNYEGILITTQFLLNTITNLW